MLCDGNYNFTNHRSSSSRQALLVLNVRLFGKAPPIKAKTTMSSSFLTDGASRIVGARHVVSFFPPTFFTTILRPMRHKLATPPYFLGGYNYSRGFLFAMCR